MSPVARLPGERGNQKSSRFVGRARFSQLTIETGAHIACVMKGYPRGFGENIMSKATILSRLHFSTYLLALGSLVTGCGSDASKLSGGDGDSTGHSSGGSGLGGAGSEGYVPIDTDDRGAWFDEQTIALRGTLSIPAANTWLMAQQLAPQLEQYDPGSTARCAVEEDASYAKVLDELGGVRWGYGVSVLPDASKPEFYQGLHEYAPPLLEAGVDNSGAGAAVEIAEADIVGVSATSALFLSSTHGLLMVDLSGDKPQFKCAAKLPGVVDQFYLYDGKLVVMVQDAQRTGSHLLHFSVANDQLSFIESVDLGRSRVLDSRRFNDRLVMYTDLQIGEVNTQNGYTNNSGYGAGVAPSYGGYYGGVNQNRVVRVFSWGDRLKEELTETHIDDTPSPDYLTRADMDRDTPLGTVIASSSRMGTQMWASDHYFVVTESQTDTILNEWKTQSYSVCIESHTEAESYDNCTTQYEERPNPNYVEPDNNGGDRSCTGTTLASCIHEVAKVSSKTIQVPVGRSCETVEYERFVCDKSEYKSYTYPDYEYETYSKLHIYEYTDDGFIRFSDQVSDVDIDQLATTDLSAKVDTLSLSDTLADLRIKGEVQAVQFQNDYLYVISDGLLQTYALAENSLLRTSELQVVSSSLQTAQFTEDKLYLSDASWQVSGEMSVLKVIDLSSAAFPQQSSTDRLLPGSQQLILPTTSGILTTGFVSQFEGQSVQLIKVGLFEDPTANELSYLFLGTDLKGTYNGNSKASYFDGAAERLFWPYSGYDLDSGVPRYRVGVSHIKGSTVVSEGAIDLALPPERVRPRPGTEQMLSFASSEIQALSLGKDIWESAAVFEYFTPVSVYRISDRDDYVEVLNLGNRCKLHFSPVDQLNARRAESITDAFLCSGYPSTAYQQNILWNDKMAVHFDSDGSFTVLEADEATALWEKAMDRDVCLLSDTIFPWSVDISVDPRNAPDLDQLMCFTRDEFAQYQSDKLSAN